MHGPKKAGIGRGPPNQGKLIVETMEFMGDAQECDAYWESISEQPVTVTAKDGTVHTIGVVTGFEFHSM